MQKIGPGRHFVISSLVWSEVAQSCLTLCDPLDWSPAGSSVHGILQARILEWVAIPLLEGIFPVLIKCCETPANAFTFLLIEEAD